MKRSKFLQAPKIPFLLFIILLILNSIIITSYSFRDMDNILCKKPILHYLFSDPVKLSNLKYDLHLTEDQVKELEFVIKDETEKLYSLVPQFKDIVGFNQTVTEIIEDSKNKVIQILADQKYIQFIEWIEEEWKSAQNLVESMQDNL